MVTEAKQEEGTEEFVGTVGSYINVNGGNVHYISPRWDSIDVMKLADHMGHDITLDQANDIIRICKEKYSKEEGIHIDLLKQRIEEYFDKREVSPAQMAEAQAD